MTNILHSNFAPNFFLYFIHIIIVYFATLFMGILFYKIIVPESKTEDSSTLKYFYELSIGLIFLITAYSIITTKFNSVFVFGLVICISYLYVSRIKMNPSKVISFKSKDFLVIILHIILLILFYSLFYYMFYIRSQGEIWSDNLFYGNLSKILNETQIESTINMLSQKNQAASIYHYSEIWFTSLNYIIFKGSYLNILQIVTFPYLFFLIIIGVYSLISYYIKSRFISITLMLVFIVFKPIIAQIPITSNYYIFSELIFFPKLFIIYIIFLFSLNNYIRGNKVLAFFSILLIVPFYTTSASGVLSGLVILLIYYNYKKNGISWKLQNFKGLIYIFIIFFGVVVFYLYQAKFSSNFNDSHEIISVKEQPYLWTMKFSLKRVLGSFLTLSPALIILYFISKKKNVVVDNEIIDIIIVVSSGIIFSSIAASIISNFIYDGHQISSNFSDPALTIVTFWIIVYAISKIKSFKYQLITTLFVSISSLILFSIRDIPFTYPKRIDSISEEEIKFYDGIKNTISKQPNPTFAFFRNYNYLNESKNKFVQTLLFLPLSKIAHLVEDGTYLPFCLSIFDIKTNNDNEYSEIENTPLFQYVKERNNKIKINNSLFSEFINEKSIDFIVIEGKVSLPKCVEENFMIIDSYQGFVFMKKK
jgi:hypothetical protein